MKGKIINNRPMVFLAVSIMLGIFISLIVYEKTNVFWILISCIIILSIILLFSMKKKIIILLLIGFLIGYFGFFIENLTSVEHFQGDEDCYIEANIEKTTTYGEANYIILKNLKVDGFRKKGKAQYIFSGENQYNVSDKVKFYGTIKNKDLSISDKDSLYLYGKSIYYDIDMTIFIEKECENFNFFEKIKNRMVSPMNEFLSPENKGVAVSLLFGDISLLTEKDSQSIRTNGINHIFAVSGLHISFVIVLIAFFIKKLRINKWIGLSTTTVLLFIYCGITRFPPSAIRASIMAILFLFAICIYKKPDFLNALGFACCAMLIFCPKILFSLSFLMSVSAVFGIILFFKPLYNFFVGNSQKKFRKFLGTSISLSLSANAILLPICIDTFGKISVYFVLANLLILPIVTLLYFILLVTSILCLISYQCGFIYLVSNLFIELIRIVSYGLSSLPLASISANSLGILNVFYVLIMIILSRFVMLKKEKKLSIIVGLLGVGIIASIII